MCANISNLIVNECLKEKHNSICSIRNAVRYVRSSPSKLNSLKQCVVQGKFSSNGLFCLDVPTRWNSTYMMLSNAINFQKAFNRMDSEDGHYRRYFEEIEKVNFIFYFLFDFDNFLIMFILYWLKFSNLYSFLFGVCEGWKQKIGSSE